MFSGLAKLGEHKGKAPVKHRFELLLHSIKPCPKNAKEVKIILIRGKKDNTKRVSNSTAVHGDGAGADWGESESLAPSNVTLYKRRTGGFDEKVYDVIAKSVIGSKSSTFARGRIDFAQFGSEDGEDVQKTIEAQLLKEAGVDLKGGKKQVTLRVTVRAYLRDGGGNKNFMSQISDITTKITNAATLGGSGGGGGGGSGCCCMKSGGGAAAAEEEEPKTKDVALTRGDELGRVKRTSVNEYGTPPAKKKSSSSRNRA